MDAIIFRTLACQRFLLTYSPATRRRRRKKQGENVFFVLLGPPFSLHLPRCCLRVQRVSTCVLFRFCLFCRRRRLFTFCAPPLEIPSQHEIENEKKRTREVAFVKQLHSNVHRHLLHTHTHTHLSVCVCVCVCVSTALYFPIIVSSRSFC